MSIRMATFCVHHILDHGPSSLDALAATAREAEVTRARDPLTTVRTSVVHDPRLIELPDGRWDCGLRLLDGVVLTHRVHASTADRDELFPGLALAPLTVFLEHEPVPLAGGGELSMTNRNRSTWSGQPVILGQPSWLPAVAAESVLGLAWTPSGLAVSRVDLDPADVNARGDRVRTVLARHATHGPIPTASRPTAAALARVVWSALYEVPDLLSEPVAPLDEMLGLPPTLWPGGWSCDPACRELGPRDRRWNGDSWPGVPDACSSPAPLGDLWDDEYDRIEPW